MPCNRASALASAALLIPLLGTAEAATYTVSKDGRGAFSTIQAAVIKAGKGDVVEILDTALYAEQVTVDAAKDGLTIRSPNPRSPAKPKILWLDTLNRNPRTCQEALDTSRINYDRNGALRIIGAKGVRLEGLIVDGGGRLPFAWNQVWGNGTDCNGPLFPLFHGNAALVLYRTARVTVRDCILRNAFFGAYIKDTNADGAFSLSTLGYEAVTGSRYGFAGTGGHLFENDFVSANAFGVAGEMLEGLPSTFRNNRFAGNGHATEAEARAVKALPDGANLPGGAVSMKADPLCPWFFEHNLFQGNYTLFCGLYRPGGFHAIHGNIFGTPMRLWSADPVFSNPFVELFPFLQQGMFRNTLASQVMVPDTARCRVSFSAFDSVNNKTVVYDSLVSACGPGIRLMNSLSAPEPSPDTLTAMIAAGGPPIPARTVVMRPRPFAFVLDTVRFGKEGARRHALRWWEPQFPGADPASGLFPAPLWPADAPADLRSETAPYRDRLGKAAYPGRVPYADQAATLLRAVPVSAALERDGKLDLRFDIQADSDVRNLAFAALIAVQIKGVGLDLFGGNPKLADNALHWEAPLPSGPLAIGANQLTIAVPWPAGGKGMIQILVRGETPDGQAVFSDWTAVPAGAGVATRIGPPRLGERPKARPSRDAMGRRARSGALRRF